MAASVSFIARSFARRSLAKVVVVRANMVGSVRFSSYFTPAHEYAQVEGKVAVCGITDYAQAALGDVVYIDLPEVGEEFEKGESFGSVESVKAASDVYAPVSGKVVAINEELKDMPDMVNKKAESDAWFIKVEMKDESELSTLMNSAAYKVHCEKKEDH